MIINNSNNQQPEAADNQRKKGKEDEGMRETKTKERS